MLGKQFTTELYTQPENKQGDQPKPHWKITFEKVPRVTRTSRGKHIPKEATARPKPWGKNPSARVEEQEVRINDNM